MQWLAFTMRVGDYTIERELDGDTFEAVHVLLARRVVLRAVGPDRATAVRVMREASILEALHHSGVPRMYECGRSGDRTWIAVERIEGERIERPSTDALIALVRDVARILEHAHARGVTHGNVRHQTIVLRKTGPCLIGWEEARLARDDGRDIHALGVFAASLVGSSAPAAFHELLAEMQAIEAAHRPSAAEVAAAAARIAAETEEELDAVDLVEIELPPPPVFQTPVPLRWTPPLGVATAPRPGSLPLGAIRPRR